MAGIDQVRLLLSELGPALELGEIQEEPGGTSWGLATRDGVIFYLEYLADHDRLWLSADVGTPRPDDRELYLLMLKYNAQWQRTGGVRVALDGADDGVVVACDLPASGLDLSGLCTIVANFQEMIAGWRQIVEAAARPDMAAPVMPGAMIRG